MICNECSRLESKKLINFFSIEFFRHVFGTTLLFCSTYTISIYIHILVLCPWPFTINISHKRHYLWDFRLTVLLIIWPDFLTCIPFLYISISIHFVKNSCDVLFSIHRHFVVWTSFWRFCVRFVVWWHLTIKIGIIIVNYPKPDAVLKRRIFNWNRMKMHDGFLFCEPAAIDRNNVIWAVSGGMKGGSVSAHRVSTVPCKTGWTNSSPRVVNTSIFTTTINWSLVETKPPLLISLDSKVYEENSLSWATIYHYYYYIPSIYISNLIICKYLYIVRKISCMSITCIVFVLY